MNMNKCLKCGGTEIVKGTIRRSTKEYFTDIVFGPDDVRFGAMTLKNGSELQPESFACLSCGMVYSSTDPTELKEFIKKHCKKQQKENDG